MDGFAELAVGHPDPLSRGGVAQRAQVRRV